MPKRFKFRLSRIIPTFQSCRIKDPSNLPVNPIPSILRLPSSLTRSNRHHHLPTSDLPASTSVKHQPSSSQTVSVGCGRRLRSRLRFNSMAMDNRAEPLPPPTLKDHFKWDKEEKWHVVAIDIDRCNEVRRSKLYISESDDEKTVVNVPQPLTKGKQRRKTSSRRNKRTGLIRVRWSTSSADSGGSFSDGSDRGVEELETFITNSTRSISTTTTTTATESSAEFSPHLETIREGPPPPQSTPAKAYNGRRRRKNEISTTRSTRLQRNGSTRNSRRRQRIAAARGDDEEEELRPRLSGSSSSSSSCDHLGLAAPARLSMALQRLVPCGVGAAVVEGKVRDSYAVAKRSEDPYEDFKVSMMEMIVEKEMVEERDLEELLRCFVSLNDKKHHRVILDAFSEIWADLFREPPGAAVPASRSMIKS